ncbi:S-layer protein [Pyrococcus kukulkanii]|uniref:S-layer protein n=1 Tax=Pyrococcus kukulkanii TaxID=1609559 RepID=UPI0035612D3E
MTPKNNIVIAFFLIFNILIELCPTLLASDNPNVVYIYYVDPSKSTIHVKLEMIGLQDDVVLRQEGFGFKCNWNITNVKFWGDGKELNLQPKVLENGCVEYKLPTSKYERVVAEYNIPVVVTRGNLDYVQYRGDDFILIRLNIITPYIPRVVPVKVKVVHPQDWEVIAPGGKKFYDSTNEILFGGCHSFLIVAKEGAFLKYSRRTQYGTLVTIYLHKKSAFQNDIVKKTFKLFEYYEGIFGPSPYGVYTFAFLPKPENMPVWGGEFPYGQAVGIEGRDYLFYVPHQIFHVWEGWPPYGMAGTPEASWQWEGINEYYVSKSLVETGIVSGYGDSPIIWYYQVYKEILDAKKDVPVSEGYKYYAEKIPQSGFSLGTEIVYRKGALVAMLLDLEIQKVTRGKKSLDDVEKLKFKEFGYHKKLYTNEDLLRIVNNVTGKDFSLFFKKYVWGTAKLPVERYFEDYDNDDIINIDENSWRATIVYGYGRVDYEYAKALKRQSVDNLLLTDRDEVPSNLFPLILVGGPLANNLTKFYLEKYFNISITNEYPGKGKGIIVAKEIGGRYVVILAGSDRWGTWAAVEIFGRMRGYPRDPILVDWNNGSPTIINGGDRR